MSRFLNLRRRSFIVSRVQTEVGLFMNINSFIVEERGSCNGGQTD